MLDELRQYLAQRGAEGCSPATIKAFDGRLRRLIAGLHSQGVEQWQDVQIKHVDAFMRELDNDGLAFTSRQSTLHTIKAYFRWLADRGRIISNPTRTTRLLRDEDDEPLLEPPLSEAEVATLIDALPRRNAAGLRNVAHVELLYSAGLRLGESLALNVADVDLDNMVVHVRAGKGGKARDIPMVRGLKYALRDYLALRRTLLRGPDHGALLLNRHGGRLSKSFFGQLVRAINRRKVIVRRVHAHLFRHSIAVHLLRGGADIRYVQEFLGHEQLETTKNYLRLVPAEIRAAYHAAMPEFSTTV